MPIRIRRLGLTAAILAGICAATGCSTIYEQSITNPISSGGTFYSTQDPYSVDMYTAFLNKEIEAVTNQLTTQCMLAQKVAKNDYPAADAVMSAESSIGIIDDVITDVSAMMPAYGYEQRRADTLTLLQNAKSSVETYIDTLNAVPLNLAQLQKVQDVMQADYIALTNEFNVPFK